MSREMFGTSILDRLIMTAKGNPRVGILMSGTGSNADNILAKRELYPNFEFVTIASDNPESNFESIAKKYRLNHELFEWDNAQKYPRTDLFQRIGASFEAQNISLVVYAGFMRISHKDFVKAFPGINIHPADLTIKDENLKPKYVGINAVEQAVEAGESYVASTVHVVDQGVDSGDILAVSKHLEIGSHESTNIESLHTRLKENCEFVVYPQVLNLLSRGRIQKEMLPLIGNELDLESLKF